MYGRRFWSRDQHEVEKTMPMFSQGMVTPAHGNTQGFNELHSKSIMWTRNYFICCEAVHHHKWCENLPGTAPRWRKMDPELLGRTVRFHPCLKLECAALVKQYYTVFLISVTVLLISVTVFLISVTVLLISVTVFFISVYSTTHFSNCTSHFSNCTFHFSNCSSNFIPIFKRNLWSWTAYY